MVSYKKVCLKINYAIVILLFVMINMCEAKVFDLLPFFDSGSVDVNELLGDRKIMNEPVIIDGVSTTLKVGIVNTSLRDYAIKLRSMNSDLKIRTSKNSIYYKNNLGNGQNELHYLTQVSEKHPVVHFSMDMPEKMPSVISWPESLPVPASAQVSASLTFTKRGSVYASFSTVLGVEQAEQEVSNSLLGEGWQSFSSLNQNSGATGGVFFKPGDRKILIVSFLETKNGSVTGSIYMKPLK